jgi:ubiquinone/menaquinone biosynthesis C-methylase UbiE
MAANGLTPEQASRVYDRIGRMQDWQRFYEGPAIADLLANADFEKARAVFELGSGTGAMAERLLDEFLPPDGTYCGVDVSPKMIRLATQRLARFSERATVRCVDGRPPLPGQSGSFDRFLALYVLDLLDEPLARDLLAEAKRLLGPDGRLCLVSLTHRHTTPSRALCAVWNRAWQLAPSMVGGCRPIDLRSLLDGWHIDHVADIVAWAVPSQIVVATPST